jgi:hypothetical protein
MATIRDALEVSAEMYKKDANGVPDYIQRHLRSLAIWEELRYALMASYVQIPFCARRSFRTSKSLNPFNILLSCVGLAPSVLSLGLPLVTALM